MNYRGPKEEEKKKGCEKIFEEIIVENFPNMGKEIVNKGHFPGGAVVKNPPANAGDVFKPWSGKIPHATEQLSPCATSTERMLYSPCATTAEAHVPRARALQQEKPPQ